VDTGTILVPRTLQHPTIRFETLAVDQHGVYRFLYTDLTNHKRFYRPLADLHTYWRTFEA